MWVAGSPCCCCPPATAAAAAGARKARRRRAEALHGVVLVWCHYQLQNELLRSLSASLTGSNILRGTNSSGKLWLLHSCCVQMARGTSFFQPFFSLAIHVQAPFLSASLTGWQQHPFRPRLLARTQQPTAGNSPGEALSTYTYSNRSPQPSYIAPPPSKHCDNHNRNRS